MTTPACPYCGEAALLVDRGVVDNHHPIGFAWACLPCDAWTPCHTNSQKPIGRLAKPDLHEARIRSLKAFTNLWKTWGASRKNAYIWLSEQMGMDISKCDFYNFTIEQCHIAEDIANDFTPQFSGGF